MKQIKIFFTQTEHTPEYIIDIINSNFREEHLKDIENARYLILNSYQVWGRIYKIINSKL